MTEHPPGTDTGLLSTVRAGTPVEAAVSDEAWLQAMLDAEAALARAQARLGFVPARSAEAITEVTRDARLDPVSLARRARNAANPVVALVADLTERVAAYAPEAADHVHRGSTSQDIMDTAAMLVSGRAIALIRADLRRVVTALAGLAAEHRDTVMPARTLAQHAVPTTFGLKAAGWLYAVDDAERGLSATASALPAQLGGAAGTLSAYHEFALADGVRGAVDEPAALALVGVFAEELGLAEPLLPWHTSRAPFVALSHELAVVAGVLGKFGLDVRNMTRTEVGEGLEPGGEGRGASSAMPQKRNPVLASLLVSAAVQVPGYASVLAQCMLAEDERPGGAWQAEWQPLREVLRLTGGAARTAAELAEGLVPLPHRMWANAVATEGQIVAERLAVRLTASLGRVRAKQCVTRIALRASAEGVPFAEAVAGDPELGKLLAGHPLEELLDPRQYLGVAGVLVDRTLRHVARTPAAEGGPDE
ncbi:lyase family protein [Streptomyces sp. NBC_01217]|uniref:lyase family protein n=1 Tax=Streptomyces sp. NBC_01217 TaxID=2903779 RepID=UPI002E159635|nr:lyase family protein [Streptomyces sp. NBC_01217]